MPWLKMDDGMWRNRKLLSVSPTAKALWTWCLSYSSDQLTDGVLSPTDMRQIAAAVGLGDWSDPMNELIAAALVDFDGKSFVMHDYLDYNPSRAQVLAEREAARKRMFALRSGEHSKNVIDPVPGPVPVPLTSTTALPPQPETEDDPVVDRLMGYQVTYTQAIQCAAGRDALAMAWMDYLDAHRHGIPNPAAFLVKSIKAGKPPPSNGLGPPGTSPPRVTGLSEADLEVQRERQRAAQTAARAGPAPPA